MFTDAFLNIDSPIHHLDARVRVIAAIVLSVAVAAVHGPPALALGLAGAIALAVIARLPLRSTLRRLLPLNLFLAVLAPRSFTCTRWRSHGRDFWPDWSSPPGPTPSC
ncbi:MAG: hypothetical protein KJ060_09455 [Candidatus Hydrogenedentes bacterium]|nr:hypothetical protein [Candidatus Hydrogenedentota bacterium]